MWLERYHKGAFTAGRSWIVQVLWFFFGSPIVASQFLPLVWLKVFTLRVFGARIGKRVVIKPGVKVKYPWRLTISSDVWIGEKAWFDNLAHISIGSNSCISQGVYLCTGSHDWSSASFDLQTSSIVIGEHVWIGAGAFIGPGSFVSDGSVLAMGAVFSGKTKAWSIYQGNPAVEKKERKINNTQNKKNILLINQNFYPDQSASSQYLQDLALSLVKEGHRVTVLASQHGHLQNQEIYSPFEEWQGIQIIRVRSIKPTKNGRLLRTLSAILLNLSFAWKLFRLTRYDTVVALTSPPLIAWTAIFFGKKPRDNFVYWVMDLNPDQVVAANILKADSFLHRLLKMSLKAVLKRSDKIIVLDSYMKDRLLGYGVKTEKIEQLNLWSNCDRIFPVEKTTNNFRERYQLNNKFVVMYSGNMSMCHPLNSVIEAAEMMRNDESLMFVFVGNGVSKDTLRSQANIKKLTNVLFIPYQETEQLADSLSAGDLHLISLAEQYVGIVHPSKFYGILSAGRPFIYLGPQKSFIYENIDESTIGIRIDTDDKEKLVSGINQFRELSNDKLLELQRIVRNKSKIFSRDVVVPRLVKTILSTSSHL